VFLLHAVRASTPFHLPDARLILAALTADYFTAPEIQDSNRHPLSFSQRSGNIVSVRSPSGPLWAALESSHGLISFRQAGHFRGLLKQGTKKVCNGMSCYTMPLTSVKSRGWSDIFLSMYNSSRILQWTITAGGDGDDKVNCLFSGGRIPFL